MAGWHKGLYYVARCLFWVSCKLMKPSSIFIPRIMSPLTGVPIYFSSQPGGSPLTRLNRRATLWRPSPGLQIRLPSSAPPTPRQAPSLADNCSPSSHLSRKKTANTPPARAREPSSEFANRSSRQSSDGAAADNSLIVIQTCA